MIDWPHDSGPVVRLSTMCELMVEQSHLPHSQEVMGRRKGVLVSSSGTRPNHKNNKKQIVEISVNINK